MTAVELRVDRTWDGTPIPAAEVAVLRLGAVPAGVAVEVEAPFRGDPPPPGAPGPTPRLWEHEVVELFVAGPAGAGGDGPEYLEVELSPHGHHLVLRLRGVRRPFAEGLPLAFEASIDGRRWRGRAVVPQGYLPPPPHRAAAFAIHGRGDGRRHLASVALPGPRPDFHRPRDFPPLLLP